MKEPTTAWTKAYLPKEIRDKEKFLLWVKVKKRLLYCGKILNYLLLIGVGLLFVYPFAWMFSMSLRPLIEALSFDPNLWVSDRSGAITSTRGTKPTVPLCWELRKVFNFGDWSAVLYDHTSSLWLCHDGIPRQKVFVVHKILGHDVTRRSHAHSRVLLLQQDGFSG